MTTPDTQPSCATTGVPTLSCLARTIALGGVLFWLAVSLGGLWMVVEDLLVEHVKFDGLRLGIGVLIILMCLVLALPWLITRRTQSMTWFWISSVTSVAALIYAVLSVS